MMNSRIGCMMLAALLAAGCGGGQSEEAVARVNGAPLLRSDFDQRLTSLLIQNQAGEDPSKAPEAMRQQAGKVVLDAMIAQALAHAAARDAGVEISDDEVELELSFSRARHASRGAFEKELARRGLTEEEFRRNLSRELLIQKYVETALAGGIDVTDEEVRAYYDANPIEFKRAESVQLRQIVVGVAKGAAAEERAEARASVERARERVRTGQDFGEVAQTLSTDASAALEGKIGDVTLEELVPPLRDAVADLPIGELSPVVKSRFGYHILLVDARQQAKELSFVDAEEMIRQQVVDQRKTARRDQWMKGLRAEARVELLSVDLVGGGTG